MIRTWERHEACRRRITIRVIRAVRSTRGWRRAAIGASSAEGTRGMRLRGITGTRCRLKWTRDMAISPEVTTAGLVNATTATIANEENNSNFKNSNSVFFFVLKFFFSIILNILYLLVNLFFSFIFVCGRKCERE